MENLIGLLRIHVQKGVNLAVRDVRSSDPYVIIKMGRQVIKLFVASLLPLLVLLLLIWGFDFLGDACFNVLC
jgi:TRAP-type mannitol/chloroaromatic compound transport system permease large subunit